MARPKTTLDAPPVRASGGRSRPLLRQLFGPDGLRHGDTPLHAGRYVIGREGDGILVEDPRVSRQHATLHVASRSYKVRISDEDSRHGTFVNGARVDETWLEDGDIIRVGDSFLLLRQGVPAGDDADIPSLVGVSADMCGLRRAIQQVAGHEVTVMIRGESGTGKEVVARAIHEESKRSGPFIAVNCAAIPHELAESQLFGHVAGSFTGARGDHAGFFRAAQGGTVFLDEIGDMPTTLQPKLLRALEQRAVVPVGATSPIAFDARVVVATHRDLEDAMNDGTFRGDLYARLAQFQVDVPPLRDRPEDVLPLLKHALGKDEKPLDAELVSRLLLSEWVFNVRELFAVASELRVRGSDADLYSADMVAHRLKSGDTGAEAPSTTSSSSQGGSTTGSGTTKDSGVDKKPPPTREELERIIVENKGNVRAISRATGRSRMQVYRWVEQYGFDLARYRD